MGEEGGEAMGGFPEEGFAQAGRGPAKLALEGLVAGISVVSLTLEVGLAAGPLVGDEGVEEPADELGKGDGVLVAASAVIVEELGEEGIGQGMGEESERSLGERELVVDLSRELGGSLRGLSGRGASVRWENHGGDLASGRSSWSPIGAGNSPQVKRQVGNLTPFKSMKDSHSTGMTLDLLAAVKGHTLDALIVECTHFGSGWEAGQTEHDLEADMTERIRTAPALVLASFTPLDLDRLVTVYKATRSAGRTFVADAYAAFVLHLVGRRVRVPNPQRAAGIRVYFNQAFERRGLTKIRQKFEADRIALSEILANPTQYVMAFRPSMTRLDFGDKLPSRCRCLYGYWEGYLTRPDWVTLREQIARAGGDFIPTHVSGHAYVEDILKFVTAVNARTVIPIHTFEPQLFQDHFSNVTRLTDGVPHDLS